MIFNNVEINTLDEIGGIPMSWFTEISLACDLFFLRRGLAISPGNLRDHINGDFKLRRTRNARLRKPRQLS